jgi:hypothetical protein
MMRKRIKMKEILIFLKILCIIDELKPLLNLS